MNEESTTTVPETGTTTIATPLGDATKTVEVNPTTGEPVEGITQDEWNQLIDLLQTISTNSQPQTVQPITMEQGDKIADSLGIIENGFLTVILAVFIVFVFRWIYRLISSWF
ncbi:MAG TPA: hypothetical protein VEV44_17130 [Pseudoneobacillus sp.]|nr:hypothetical protein [Pseudoneobacillus sp.]